MINKEPSNILQKVSKDPGGCGVLKKTVTFVSLGIDSALCLSSARVDARGGDAFVVLSFESLSVSLPCSDICLLNQFHGFACFFAGFRLF